MKAPSVKPVRCAIYTRVSTEHGLDQEFNSLDAQYDAASAYIKSQAHAGWTLIRSRYDDGGYSGGSTDRPDLQKLLDDIRARIAEFGADAPRPEQWRGPHILAGLIRSTVPRSRSATVRLMQSACPGCPWPAVYV
jgi:hypothetical protein